MRVEEGQVWEDHDGDCCRIVYVRGCEVCADYSDGAVQGLMTWDVDTVRRWKLISGPKRSDGVHVDRGIGPITKVSWSRGSDSVELVAGTTGPLIASFGEARPTWEEAVRIFDAAAEMCRSRGRGE